MSVRRLLEEYKVREARGYRVYSARALHRQAGIAVPLDVVVELLTLEGYRAEEVEEGLKTTASPGEVIDAARRVAEAIKLLEGVYAARTAKKLLAVARAYTLIDLEEIIEACLSLGVLGEEGDGKLVVRGPWRSALKRLITKLEG